MAVLGWRQFAAGARPNFVNAHRGIVDAWGLIPKDLLTSCSAPPFAVRLWLVNRVIDAELVQHGLTLPQQRPRLAHHPVATRVHSFTSAWLYAATAWRCWPLQRRQRSLGELHQLLFGQSL
jgi:hypothetical protein